VEKRAQSPFFVSQWLRIAHISRFFARTIHSDENSPKFTAMAVPRGELAMAMEGEGAAVSRQVADFSCADHEGATRTLGEFLSSGNSVILWFYPKASTGG
jgi:hypothetical protein